jgi:hypothetical protein
MLCALHDMLVTPNMNMQLILLLLLCSGLIGVSDGTDSKRLLLNEPTIFQDRLNRVENMLAILQNTVKQQAMIHESPYCV